MNEVIGLKVLEDYRIWLNFNDGEEKVVNFRPYIGKGFSAELLDHKKFRRVFIESGGSVAVVSDSGASARGIYRRPDLKNHLA